MSFLIWRLAKINILFSKCEKIGHIWSHFEGSIWSPTLRLLSNFTFHFTAIYDTQLCFFFSATEAEMYWSWNALKNKSTKRLIFNPEKYSMWWLKIECHHPAISSPFPNSAAEFYPNSSTYCISVLISINFQGFFVQKRETTSTVSHDTVGVLPLSHSQARHGFLSRCAVCNCQLHWRLQRGNTSACMGYSTPLCKALSQTDRQTFVDLQLHGRQIARCTQDTFWLRQEFFSSWLK